MTSLRNCQIISKDLKWEHHINDITNKGNKVLGFLRRNLKICSQRVKELAYKTFVRPTVEYACTVWDPHVQQEINKLESVQRRAARFVLRRYHQTASPSEMIRELKWPSLQKRRKVARLTMLFKIQNDIVSARNIKNDIKTAPTRRRRTNSKQYTLPQCKTDYRLNSFLPRTLKEWNELPEQAVEATTVGTFVSRVSSLH